MVFQPNSL